MKYKFPHRIIYLTAIIQELNVVTNKNIHNALYTSLLDRNDLYNFVIISNQPYSFQAVEDLQFLIRKRIAIEKEGMLSIEHQERFAKKLDMFEKISIQKLKTDGIPNIFLEHLPNIKTGFYTIGYEGINIDQYINKLKENGVLLLCDVRKNAYSQKYGFNKHEMQNALNLSGIEYIHLSELGITSEDRHNAKSIQKLLQEYYDYTLEGGMNNIKKLLALYEKYQSIAITCFEAKYMCCHRGKIAKILKEVHNIDVRHI